MLRKTGRILLVGAAIVMVVVWIALAASWVRSYWRGDSIVVRQTIKRGAIWPTLTLGVASGKGGLAIGVRRLRRERYSPPVDPPDQVTWATSSSPSYPHPRSAANVFTERSVPPIPTAGMTLTGNATVNITGGSLTVERIYRWSGGEAIPTPPSTMNVSTVTSIAAPLAAPAATPGQVVNAWGFHLSQLIRPYTVARGLGESNWVVILPYWAAVVLLGIPTYLLARTGLTVVGRARGAKAGCCIGCGYDLRASPDRCPECGRPAPGHNPSAHVA